MAYIPKLDVSNKLDAEEANYLQSQIGILQWIVELGQVNIITEVSTTLSSHLAMPRKGHLDAALHIFAYLKNKHSTCIVFDSSYQILI